MIFAFKKIGWFRKIKILFFVETEKDFLYYEMNKISKYAAAGILDYRQIKRLRDFLSNEIERIDNDNQ